MRMEEIMSMILWFVMGICIFSFLNVVIYRVPNQMDFVRGRSICPSCGHTLSGKDLVPLFSWVFLGGKCRYCKTKVSSRYFFVELFGGLCAVLSWYLWGNTPKAVLYFFFFGLLTVIGLVDWDTMTIPNGFVITMLLLAIASFFFGDVISPMERLIGFFVVSLPMFLLTVFIPGAFGGGDIKLMAVVGIFLGWKLCLFSFFVGVIVGGIYAVYLLKARKKGRKDHLPFGPFLCIGMMVAVCVGNDFIHWYFSSLGF